MLLWEKIKDFKKRHPLCFYIILFLVDVVLLSIVVFISSHLYAPYLLTSLIIILFNLEFLIIEIFGAVRDLWQENPTILVAGIIAWLIIGVIISITNNTPGEITKDIIVYLATIGALLFAFVPQGLININEKYRPKGICQPYDTEKLLKKIKDISYFLAIFIGTAVLDILISPIFHNLFVKTTKGAKNSLHYIYFVSGNHFIILKIFALLYIVILIYAVAALILGFLEIFTILKYFYYYEYNFDALKSKYIDWTDSQIDWVIKNGLQGYFINNKYEIKKTIRDFICKFNELSKPKQCKSKTFKTIWQKHPDIITKKYKKAK
ncbi:MAG: hypothetical protein ACYCT7_03130 [bacterium]